MACVLTGGVHAQAYCALRDPVRVLYDSYPEADAYRSIIRTVGVADRDAIAKQLPFTILYDELGRHTLYIALRDGRPLGLFHVRSERSRYGLTEIAWSLDLEGRITGGSFQRCRDQKLRDAFDSDLQDQIIGADIPTILTLLQKEGMTPEQFVLLSSAAKTAAVTLIVWNDDLLPMRAAIRSNAIWPESEVILRSESIAPSAFSADSGIEPSTVRAWSARGGDGQYLGQLVRSWIRFDNHRIELWWQIDLNGRIVAVSGVGVLPSGIQTAFAEVVGKSEATISGCSTAAGVVAGELLQAIDQSAAGEKGQ
ncbi:MAG: hypothetical protein P8I91_01865 [Phycisphaerales bacterium]|nr:hypothetical protein [Phycisphaerales bacterium]